jgi:hypothetical protein
VVEALETSFVRNKFQAFQSRWDFDRNDRETLLATQETSASFSDWRREKAKKTRTSSKV